MGLSIRGEPCEPVAVKESLGWVLSGSFKGKVFASVNYCDKNCSVNGMNVSACIDMADATAKVNKL